VLQQALYEEKKKRRGICPDRKVKDAPKKKVRKIIWFERTKESEGKMKIKKTLFSTEIEFSDNEFQAIRDQNPFDIWFPLFRWLNENFGFKFFEKGKK